MKDPWPADIVGLQLCIIEIQYFEQNEWLPFGKKLPTRLTIRKVQVGQNIKNLFFRRKRKETIIKSSFRCFYCQLLHKTNK